MTVIAINIPESETLALQHLVLDFNGTLACDGGLLPGTKERLQVLVEKLQVHVVTADIFGKAREALRGISCDLSILSSSEQQAEAKLAYLWQLGADNAVCIGNGRNDRLMLKESALGIAVVQDEGAAVVSLLVADVVTTSILDALDLLINPLRLIATLRA
jgi:soluble P-type ATPase